MRKIAESYGGQYTGRKPSNKYLKDWYVLLTEEEEPQTHKYNLWYLRRIVKFLQPSAPEDLNENLCLQYIIEYLPTKESLKLFDIPSSIPVDTSAILYAILKDKHNQPLANKTINFEINGTTVYTNKTDSEGIAFAVYTPTETGHPFLRAVSNDYLISDSKSLNVVKHTSEITGTIITPTDIKVDGTFTILGNLAIDGVGASGKTINIYDGNTVIGTTTTSSTGAFRYDSDPITSVGTMQVKAVFESDSKHNGSQSSTSTITISRNSSALTINTPVITYMDDFEVTGTLMSGLLPISNATVKLSWSVGGETQIATATTNSQGVVTFSRTAPTTITTYSFQLIFDGNEKYNSANSQTINVGVDKETSILTITSPTNGAVMYDTGSMTVSGTLMDNDSPNPNPIANQTVYARNGVITLASYTTDSNGVISGVLDADDLSIGHNYIDFVFEGTNEYVGSSQTNIDVRVVEGESLSLTASPDVLSYADSTVENPQIATFTAIHSGGSGKTVQLCDKSDDSVIATMTDTGNGIYTYEYESQGIGDIEYYAKDGSLVSETYDVQDCLFYNSLTSDKGLFSVTQGSANLVYSDNGLKVTGTQSVDTAIPLSYQLPNTDYSVEFKVMDSSDKSSGAYTTSIGTEDAMIVSNYSAGLYARKISASGDFWVSHSRYSSGTVIKKEVTGTSTKTIKYYRDDNYLGQGTGISQNRTFQFRSYNNRMIQIKDLKIKPL